MPTFVLTLSVMHYVEEAFGLRFLGVAESPPILRRQCTSQLNHRRPLNIVVIQGPAAYETVSVRTPYAL